ncbi:MAG: FAD-binding oxidoreductase [Nostocaceae cyanobacterium]|nr:FAD-binding oxidoreductase [Nostocaceae cyanobacterium]
MKAIAPNLASIVGEENAVSWEETETSQQKSILSAIAPGNTPSCIVYPGTEEELAAVITTAHKNHWRVLPCGNGSKLHWGGLAKGVDIVVSTKRLNNLIEHAVGDLTITVEAGIKFADIQEILAKEHQFLALDPNVPESATIGGIIATGNTGSLRQRYGSVRDQILGIRFVRSDGEVAKAGGKVVKNVAGYDLMKLFTGSYGTLGVITQVTFRVYPLPQASQTVVLTGSGENVSKAASILRNYALTPTQADLVSPQLVSDLGLGQGMGLMARFQSIPESVKEQSQRLLQVGEKLGLHGTYVAGDEADLWKRLRESMNVGHHESAITCKIGVLPTAAVDVLQQAELGVVHVGSGLGMLRFEDEKGLLEMQNFCEAKGGFLSVLVAPIRVKENLDVWGYTGNALELMRLIKKQFDGEEILSCGRFVGGI